MTFRRTLTEMLRELRAEIGMATDVSLQANVIDTHTALLQRNQRLLYDSEMWPHLETSFDVEVLRGATELALPEGLNPGAIQSVFVRSDEPASRAVRLQHGWSQQETVASEPDELSWPVRFWRLQSASDPAQDVNQRRMVFWPLPDRDVTFTIYGRRALGPFVDDTDHATLDSDLIVLQTAAELLNEQGSSNASVKAAAAQQRKRDLLARERGDVAGPTSMLPGLNPQRR